MVLALGAAMAGADRLTTWSEDRFYGDRVLYKATSDYQLTFNVFIQDLAQRFGEVGAALHFVYVHRYSPSVYR